MVFAEASELTLHAFLELAAEKVGNVGTERLERHAEESGARTVAGKGATLHEIDECRRIVRAGAEQLFGHAA